MHTVKSLEIVRLEEDKSMHERAYVRVWMNSLIFYDFTLKPVCVSVSLILFCSIWVIFLTCFIVEQTAHSVSWDTHMYSTYTATSLLHFLLFSAALAWFSVCLRCITTYLCLVSSSSSEYRPFVHAFCITCLCTWNIELALGFAVTQLDSSDIFLPQKSEFDRICLTLCMFCATRCSRVVFTSCLLNTASRNCHEMFFFFYTTLLFCEQLTFQLFWPLSPSFCYVCMSAAWIYMRLTS